MNLIFLFCVILTDKEPAWIDFSFGEHIYKASYDRQLRTKIVRAQVNNTFYLGGYDETLSSFNIVSENGEIVNITQDYKLQYLEYQEYQYSDIYVKVWDRIDNHSKSSIT